MGGPFNLHTDARPILPTELAQLRQALAGARVNERQMTIAAQHALAVSNALGIKPRARPLPATAQLCGLPAAGPSA